VVSAERAALRALSFVSQSGIALRFASDVWIAATAGPAAPPPQSLAITLGVRQHFDDLRDTPERTSSLTWAISCRTRFIVVNRKQLSPY